jgi:hypothetical protein
MLQKYVFFSVQPNKDLEKIREAVLFPEII